MRLLEGLSGFGTVGLQLVSRFSEGIYYSNDSSYRWALILALYLIICMIASGKKKCLIKMAPSNELMNSVKTAVSSAVTFTSTIDQKLHWLVLCFAFEHIFFSDGVILCWNSLLNWKHLGDMIRSAWRWTTFTNWFVMTSTETLAN